MLYRNKNREWTLCKYKIKYNQHGKEVEQYVGIEGKQWWVDFADKWGHTDIVEFTDIMVTDGQLARLEEVNNLNIPDGHSEVCSSYVRDNKFPDIPNHILKTLELQKQNEVIEQELNESNMELASMLNLVKIQTETSQAEMLMEIGMLLQQLQGGNE